MSESKHLQDREKAKMKQSQRPWRVRDKRKKLNWDGTRELQQNKITNSNTDINQQATCLVLDKSEQFCDQVKAESIGVKSESRPATADSSLLNKHLDLSSLSQVVADTETNPSQITLDKSETEPP